jgi:hypothetical protein
LDAQTFDRVTVEAARRPTRRAALRFFTGTLLSGLLAQRAASSTRAAQIDIAGPPSAGTLCAAQGLTDCGGVCIDTTADPYNCGACGRACGAGDTCSGGACVAGAVSETTLDACAAQGLTDCGWACIDTFSDSANCGACGNSCPLGGFCHGGACVSAVCSSGLVDCGTGYCADLSSDSSHCGACGNSCPLGGYCAGGTCTGLICLDGLTDCYGRCVDLSSDWSHCGGCEFGCFDGASCVNGQCVE